MIKNILVGQQLAVIRGKNLPEHHSHISHTASYNTDHVTERCGKWEVISCGKMLNESMSFPGVGHVNQGREIMVNRINNNTGSRILL